MNILFVIGNGFDLNLKLPTSYPEFYRFYTSQTNIENDDIQNLKDNIVSQPMNWSDLEVGMGKYVAKLTTDKSIDNLHKELIKSLSYYLNKIEENYNCDDSKKLTLFDYLMFPEKMFEKEDFDRIRIFRNTWNNTSPWRVQIITLNYTKILEKLLGFHGRKIMMGNSESSRQIFLSEIEHIHGDTERGMNLGLNDISQFLNDDFKEVRLISNKYIKSQFNSVRRTGHDNKCQNWIKQANLMCLFGLSYGETDKRWWDYIGQRLLTDHALLLIFHFDKEINRGGHEIAEMIEDEERVKDDFLSKTSLTPTERGAVSKKIYVAINSRIFKIDATEFKYNDWTTSLPTK